MTKNKQQIIWKLQKKVDSYFNNKKRLAKHDIFQSACKTVIWLMVEKGYAITSACICIGKKQRICSNTIADILRQHILSKKHLERHSKMCQSKFFKKLKNTEKYLGWV